MLKKSKSWLLRRKWGNSRGYSH